MNVIRKNIQSEPIIQTIIDKVPLDIFFKYHSKVLKTVIQHYSSFMMKTVTFILVITSIVSLTKGKFKSIKSGTCN